MNYTQLTEAERAEIRRQKLHALEVDHARLTLDIELATASDIDNEQVRVARANLALITRQHATLVERMAPALGAGNGQNAPVQELLGG